MNALQRASIEKAGHDNGWEVTLSKNEDSVTLGSSQHSGRMTVSCDAAGIAYTCGFSNQACLKELKQNFQDIPFLPDGSCSLPNDILPNLLRRAAQLLRSLPTAPEEQYKKQVVEVLTADPAIFKTEAEAIVKRRIGQNLFRKALMDYWGGQCAVTAVVISEVLRASHCKPWADCTTDAERLDVYNGLLLTANLDALFDQGLISFSDQGKIIISDRLPLDSLPNLGIHPSMTLRCLSTQHQPYLAYHREFVLQKKEKLAGE